MKTEMAETVETDTAVAEETMIMDGSDTTMVTNMTTRGRNDVTKGAINVSVMRKEVLQIVLMLGQGMHMVCWWVWLPFSVSPFHSATLQYQTV